MPDFTDASQGQPVISAEVVPAPGRRHQAAAVLLRLGVRVLHLGPTISVSAPEEVWERTFGLPEPAIPRELGGLVTGIHLAGPPDLH
ncbi:MAG TPA: hypothetical protein VM347_06460 [Nonomuraea sp.]|nr:hypothetical protein [Nonomuraea sp.]